MPGGNAVLLGWLGTAPGWCPLPSRERAWSWTWSRWLQFLHEGSGSHRYGPPDVVRSVEVDQPVPKDNQVLVRVHATTVNRTDCGFRAGRPFFVRALTGLPRPKVTVLWTEFAGQVEAVGHGAASAMTWSWMRWARARSCGAGGC
jgi:hypothetical protein